MNLYEVGLTLMGGVLVVAFVYLFIIAAALISSAVHP